MGSTPAISALRTPSPKENTPLPSYITRHFDLGFDANDVSVLIASIDASQNRTPSPGLQNLPPEVLFHIVGYVPVGYILQWRLVCRAFRDCIDGPIMYSCIRRAEIIGHLGSPETLQWAGIPSDAHGDLTYMHCTFECLEHYVRLAGPRITNAKWGASHAVFCINDAWYERFLRAEQLSAHSNKSQNWSTLMGRLRLESNADDFGKMRWCMQLDSAVLDLGFPVQSLRDKLFLHLPSRRVTIEWKELLLRFIQAETQLRTIMEQKRDSMFSFGYEEDCLRETRRRRLRASLNESVTNASLTRWALNTLPGLFGRRERLEPAEEFRHWRRSEDSAIGFLMLARKEAGMSKAERDQLWQLSKDHSDMITALDNIGKKYAEWQNTLLETCVMHDPLLLDIKRNPFTWSDEERSRREARVLKWKAQQKSMQQVVRLLEESIEAVSVPEDAFDELGSDI